MMNEHKTNKERLEFGEWETRRLCNILQHRENKWTKAYPRNVSQIVTAMRDSNVKARNCK